jgi:uncharacterized protein (DUF362 family)
MTTDIFYGNEEKIMNKFLSRCVALLNKEISRKRFLKIAGVLVASMAFSRFLSRFASAAVPAVTTGRVKKNLKGLHDLIEVESQDAYAGTRKAIEALGGIKRFVKKRDTVVIKPNMAWDRAPEYAANTNPEVVAALIDLCKEAGAKRINVFDVTCNDNRLTYDKSGIAAIAKEHGARVFFPDDWNMMEAHFPYKSSIEKWPIVREAIECDVFINVPVCKDHRLTRLTLSMKNLMGVCGGERGEMHFDIGPKLVDLTDLISPELTVIDATRVLLRNGPTGGNLDDVKVLNKIIAGTDSTLLDVYSAQLMSVDPLDVPNIKHAIERSFGNHLVENASVLKLTV